MDKLYIVGSKVGGGYPEGRYIARKLEGKVVDYYIIIGMLNYPSIRAVANPTAWSGAKAKRYGSMTVSERGERAARVEVYDGYAEDSEDAYNESLLEAMEAERIRMAKIGDEDAALEMARREALLKKRREERWNGRAK